ncbi:GGDEF domain-containing protein [Kangiella sp. HZ709]|uniref:GGDEF domain-containing protein n=1 Tax=Kangiella sp. HZ709 TaxID=2666328 RepID=UPI0012B04484|nr:GGDEF domain-containing protein [Kangiella sp. HZ709]MRX27679.1 diguanylate cyclase [Kangiella sp. HZ709]
MKIKILLILLIWCSFSVVAAEKDFLEVLKAADKIKTSQPSEFLDQMDSLEKNKQDFSEKERDYFNYLLVWSLILKGHSENAIETFKVVIQESNYPEVKYKAGMSLANMYAAKGSHLDAITQLNLSLELESMLENQEERNRGYVIAGIIYNLIGDNQSAKEYGLKIQNNTTDPRTYCFAENILVEAEFKIGNLNVADERVKNSIKVCSSINEVIPKNVMLSFIATQYVNFGESKKAVNLLLENLQEVESTEYQYLIGTYYSRLAEGYWELEELENAEKFAKKAINLQVEQSEWAVSSYNVLYKIFREKKLYDQSLFYHEKFYKLSASLADTEQSKRMAHELVKQQTNEKQREIELLNKQNEVLKLEQDLSKEEASNNRLMVILLIFILTSLAFWTYRVKRNQIKLKRQSETDLLTGVSSRQHFYFMCRKTLEHAKKTNQEVTFVLFDMDGFKSVNDNYGHLVGDWVLKKAVSVCIPCWRQNDIAGRLGGEEFALMLPTCNMEKAKEIAEKCRKAIEAVDTSDSGHKFPLSASFGITTTRLSGYELSKVIGDADKTMYQAKAAGKNQVCCVEISSD